MWVFWGSSLYLVQPSDLRQVGNWAWGNGDQIKAAVGNHFSIVGQDRDALQWRLGIDGGVFMNFQSGGPMTFHLLTMDGTFAVPLDIRMKGWHIRTEWRHDSAHFGDGIRLVEDRPPIGALDALSYESLGGYVGWHSRFLEPQLGFRMATKHQGSLIQASLNVFDSERSSTPYLASTLRQGTGVFGALGLSSQLGYQWKGDWTFRTGVQGYIGSHDAGKMNGAHIRFMGVFINWNAIGLG